MKSSSIDRIGNVSNASVLKGTKKEWSAWLTILNRAGAQGWTHKEIVSFLKKKHRLSAWWQQKVTHGYEIHIKRRVAGQNQKGHYTVTVTKSYGKSQKEAWKLLTSSEGLRAWLNPMSDFSLKPKATFEVEGGIYGEVRTMKAPARIRIAWHDGEDEKPTYVQVHAVKRANGKSILAIYHDGLKSAREKESMRAHWRKAINHLVSLEKA